LRFDFYRCQYRPLFVAHRQRPHFCFSATNNLPRVVQSKVAFKPASSRIFLINNQCISLTEQIL